MLQSMPRAWYLNQRGLDTTLEPAEKPVYDSSES